MGKILIVDAEPSVCETLTWILQKEGHQIDSVRYYQSANILVKKNEYDVYLIDPVLSDGDGVSLVKSIHDLGKKAPIIVFMGYLCINTIITMIRLGVYDCLMKPVLPGKIKAIVQHALEINMDISEV